MVHLFAALPIVEGERIQVEHIHNCRRLSHEWQAYISRTHSLQKTFISVKGIYCHAEVEGQKITWQTPHALQQVLTDDVDFNVMRTFSEFYEALLGFVNFKLYHSINVKYPPILDPRMEALAAELYALCRYISTGSGGFSGNPDGKSEVKKADKGTEESELRLAQLPANEPGYKRVIAFCNSSFWGVVSWEGDGSPFRESYDGITHQIVERPTQGHIFLSREYVQPQWMVPPPHLSPFVDNEAEGYIPEYAETIKRLQAAVKKQELPMPGLENQDLDDPQTLLLMMLEKQYHDELNMELQGITYSTSLSNKKLERSVEDVKEDTVTNLEESEDLSKISVTQNEETL
ncbi:Pescadillo N-terminus [Musa troglodytarum]|uniref:Pescadillo N-terminus n=1 Tax=Musa troglodytarum TaxID=320322 RepID=A0A9E7GNW4_9LILI|nr:Pescadillo N-terminus [Musa troglodytarum]